MTEAQQDSLRIAARMLAYPDADFMNALHWLEAEAERVGVEEAEFVAAFRQCAAAVRKLGQEGAAREYVATFDHASDSSPYLAWHRYGNDRSQGKALAALNGLYRTAGFEPLPGVMPDYLPRVLEFLSIAPEWAGEALLDGFGPELAGIIRTLETQQSPYAGLLAASLGPLRQLYPGYFQPRTGPDPTRRPMARPEPEPDHANCITPDRGCGCGQEMNI